jgi:hypothetical protein
MPAASISRNASKPSHRLAARGAKLSRPTIFDGRAAMRFQSEWLQMGSLGDGLNK